MKLYNTHAYWMQLSLSKCHACSGVPKALPSAFAPAPLPTSRPSGSKPVAGLQSPPTPLPAPSPAAYPSLAPPLFSAEPPDLTAAYSTQTSSLGPSSDLAPEFGVSPASDSALEIAFSQGIGSSFAPAPSHGLNQGSLGALPPAAPESPTQTLPSLPLGSAPQALPASTPGPSLSYSPINLALGSGSMPGPRVSPRSSLVPGPSTQPSFSPDSGLAFGPAQAPSSTPTPSPLVSAVSPPPPPPPRNSPSSSEISPPPSSSPVLPPTIQLIGSSTVILQLGQAYTEQGAASNDAADGTLTGNITYLTLCEALLL